MLTLCSRPFEGRGQGRRAAVPQATELLGLPPGCASVVRRTQITSPAGTSFSPFPPRGNSRVLAFFILTLLSSPFFSSHSDSAGHNAGGAEGHAGLGPACSFPRLCLAPRRSPSRQLPPRGPPAGQRSGRLRTGRLWGSSQGPRATGRVSRSGLLWGGRAASPRAGGRARGPRKGQRWCLHEASVPRWLRGLSLGDGSETGASGVLAGRPF